MSSLPSSHVPYFRNVIVLHSFLNVTVNASSVFSEVKFLDCLQRFFDGVLATFLRCHKTLLVVFDFDKLSS